MDRFKIILKQLKWGVWAGLFFILAFVVIYYRNYDPIEAVMQELKALPDYDYIRDVKNLMAEKKWGEAKVLCDNIINSNLPSAPEAEELRKQCEKESKKVWNRIYKGGRAFITGNPDNSIEELGGSMASDMLLYGDIRDLALQGYYKITKQETDVVIIALASCGIATEFIDFADWAPAALKAIRKVGAMSEKMADSILQMTKKITQTRKLDSSSKAFFSDTKKLLDKSGFIRTRDMFKVMDSPADAAKLVKHAEKSPELTHLIIQHYGKDGLKLLDGVAPHKNSKIIIRMFVLKKPVSLAFSTVKTYHKGTLQRFVLKTADLFLKNLSAKQCTLIVFILVGAGAICTSVACFYPALCRKQLFKFGKSEHRDQADC
ncbi:MAG: hypothetical protein IJW31_04280 [Lentisphaeria bacterium]|nr:hypothetical protein [Lentisphaeria bacterium]